MVALKASSENARPSGVASNARPRNMIPRPTPSAASFSRPNARASSPGPAAAPAMVRPMRARKKRASSIGPSTDAMDKPSAPTPMASTDSTPTTRRTHFTAVWFSRVQAPMLFASSPSLFRISTRSGAMVAPMSFSMLVKLPCAASAEALRVLSWLSTRLRRSAWASILATTSR